MEEKNYIPQYQMPIDLISVLLSLSGLCVSVFVGFSKTVRPGLELYFLVPLTFAVCQSLFGRVLYYSVGGIGIKTFIVIESIRSVLLPVLIVVSNGIVSPIRMSYVSTNMYVRAVIIQCVEILVFYITIYYEYPKLLRRQSIRYESKRKYQYSGKIRVLGAMVIGLFLLVLVVRINVWLPALKLFLLKENATETKILLENTMLTCVKIVLLAVTAQKTSKCERYTRRYYAGMILVLFLLLFNSLSYFGSNRVFVLENMIASIMIVWIALPHTRKVIAICIVPIGLALIFTMIVVKQFNLETASEFSTSIINVQSIANTVEEYTNGPWCIAQSLDAAQGLSLSERVSALIADFGNGLGGIADLPFVKGIVKYTSQYKASSRIMKEAFETYDRGQMLSLSGGVFIPFGEILGWFVFPIVNYCLARLLIYVEVKSKIVDSLLYKYMYIWMSLLFGLTHCYCLETIIFCWSKFIFIYWIVLKINDLPVTISVKSEKQY